MIEKHKHDNGVIEWILLPKYKIGTIIEVEPIVSFENGRPDRTTHFSEIVGIEVYIHKMTETYMYVLSSGSKVIESKIIGTLRRDNGD